MKYCLDSSTYIQAHRTYYAFDIAPSFWAALEKLAGEGLIFSPIAVLIELLKGKDELSSWAAKMNSGLFVDPDTNVSKEFSAIANFTNTNYADAHWVREFLSGADPWVIAHAKAHNLTVVTMEDQKSVEEIDKPTGRYKGKIKIPNMCGHFKVNCMNTFDLLRGQNIGI